MGLESLFRGVGIPAWAQTGYIWVGQQGATVPWTKLGKYFFICLQGWGRDGETWPLQLFSHHAHGLVPALDKERLLTLSPEMQGHSITASVPRRNDVEADVEEKELQVLWCSEMGAHTLKCWQVWRSGSLGQRLTFDAGQSPGALGTWPVCVLHLPL